jgi:hypothetical protein
MQWNTHNVLNISEFNIESQPGSVIYIYTQCYEYQFNIESQPVSVIYI